MECPHPARRSTLPPRREGQAPHRAGPSQAAPHRGRPRPCGPRSSCPWRTSCTRRTGSRPAHPARAGGVRLGLQHGMEKPDASLIVPVRADNRDVRGAVVRATAVERTNCPTSPPEGFPTRRLSRVTNGPSIDPSSDLHIELPPGVDLSDTHVDLDVAAATRRMWSPSTD
jgi:hypothetical protein